MPPRQEQPFPAPKLVILGIGLLFSHDPLFVPGSEQRPPPTPSLSYFPWVVTAAATHPKPFLWPALPCFSWLPIVAPNNQHGESLWPGLWSQAGSCHHL